MSVTIGVYDFFSYMIPGSLYLLTAIYVLSTSRIFTANFQDVELTAELIIITGIAGYVVGLILNSVARVVWHRILKQDKVGVNALREFKARKSKVEAAFDIDDWPILFAYIRHNSPENALVIEKNKAVSIMLRNVSCCSFTFALIQIVQFFRSNFSLLHLGLGIGAITFSILAARTGFTFNRWFFLMIYESAISLGPEMLDLIGQRGESDRYSSAGHSANSKEGEKVLKQKAG